jgi:thioredoxin 1
MKHSQGFGALAVVGIIAVVALIGGFVFVSSQNSDKAAMEAKVMEDKMKMEEDAMMEKKAMEEKAMMEQDTMKAEGGAMMDTEDESMMKKEESMEGDSMMKKEDSAMMQKSGTYAAYSADTLAMAQKGKTVLFFHAGWCPTCRSADSDITAGAATIPAGVTILKTDYDKEVALKQKYGVTTQHTFVEVDSTGKMLQKWSGGNLAGIVAKL